jgi:aryl-alcohol dehydrogenase-like predicted oxidoreductase
VPIADEIGVSLPTLALAWVLRRGELASAITGASRPEQVHANARASGVELSDDVLKQIDEALGDAPVRTPTLAPFATEGIKHR